MSKSLKNFITVKVSSIVACRPNGPTYHDSGNFRTIYGSPAPPCIHGAAVEWKDGFPRKPHERIGPELGERIQRKRI